MPDNVWVLAFKQAEARSDRQGKSAPPGTIVRIQERSGAGTKATIKSPVLGLSKTVDLASWELKTMLIQRSGDGPSSLREVSLLET
jgi:alpha-mannosidase